MVAIVVVVVDGANNASTIGVATARVASTVGVETAATRVASTIGAATVTRGSTTVRVLDSSGRAVAVEVKGFAKNAKWL